MTVKHTNILHNLRLNSISLNTVQTIKFNRLSTHIIQPWRYHKEED